MTDVNQPGLSRAEIEEFWDSWLDINRQVEITGDWRPMAEWYAEDATYGWMYGPDEHFMAVGRDQVRDWAIGIEMDGLDGWHYDYVCSVIDDKKAMIVGFWKQRSGITDDNGDEYEILGLGGSWFGVKRVTEGADAGLIKIDWQRDWFDLPSTGHTFVEILKSGKAPDTLMKRPGQPSEVAPAYVFLASDDARYITGQLIHVNGGGHISA